MSTIIQPSKRFAWGNFFRQLNSLHWYDACTSFVFRFLAKTSEPLLAGGVVLSAIDFLQKGQLLANNAELSLWWSIAQGVAMEVSVGPVLVCALDAREDGDQTKAVFYSVLSAVLAFVGGAMLFMQFGLSVAGLTEHQIHPAILWSLFFFRTVASISYIALSCTKQKRFSGVSPKVTIAETHKAFEDAVASMTRMHQESIGTFSEQVHQRLAMLTTRLAQAERTNSEHAQAFLGELHSLLDTHTEQVRVSLADAFTAQIQTVHQDMLEEMATVKETLDEQAKLIKRNSERTPPNPITEPVSLRQFHSAKAKLATSDFDKGKFVTECLMADGEISGADIQRKANELGQSISAGYISDIRKTLHTEQLQATGGN